MIRVLPPVTVLLAALSPAFVHSQSPHRVGTYELVSIGGRQPPIMLSRLIPGEGTTLQSARLQLLAGGMLRGELVVSYTDSGTVTDTMLVQGTWRAAADTVRLAYEWSRPRWQGGERVFESHSPTTCLIQQSQLAVPELAYFSSEFFGLSGPLLFRRVS